MPLKTPTNSMYNSHSVISLPPAPCAIYRSLSNRGSHSVPPSLPPLIIAVVLLYATFLFCPIAHSQTPRKCNTHTARAARATIKNRSATDCIGSPQFVGVFVGLVPFCGLSSPSPCRNPLIYMDTGGHWWASDSFEPRPLRHLPH